jgi:hypothetical protein
MPAITETAEINVNTDALWKEIGGFGAVGDWHPMLERLDVSRAGKRATRIARGKDGSEQVERLTRIDPSRHVYQYTMERSALPVRDYVGKFHIEPVGSDASRVVWSAQFELADDGDGKTIETVRQFLHAGTENLKTKYGAIPGYDYGAPHAAHSPVALSELRALEQTVGWTARDAKALKMAADVLSDQAEELVDHWRTQIGAQPRLARWFVGPNGRPDDAYKAAVKKRFVQWVIDLCTRPRDQAWLDYQEEIGLRHTPAKKNATERAETPELVPLRYLIAFAAPVVLDAKDFLARKGHGLEDIERMHAAWTKSVLLEIALWSRPYVGDGLW